MFVTFEGIEGAGKSTQLRLLAEALTPLMIPGALVVTKEPGGTETGQKLRELLLTDDGKLPRTEVFIVMASRNEVVEKVIRPALAEGNLVLCDRYIDTTLTIQGYGLGVPLDELRTLNALSTGGLMPDLTLYFDMDPKVGAERKRGQPEEHNHFDERILSTGDRIRNGYRELMRIDPFRWRAFDGTLPIETIAAQVLDTILSHHAFPTAKLPLLSSLQ